MLPNHWPNVNFFFLLVNLEVFALVLFIIFKYWTNSISKVMTGSCADKCCGQASNLSSIEKALLEAWIPAVGYNWSNILTSAFSRLKSECLSLFQNIFLKTSLYAHEIVQMYRRKEMWTRGPDWELVYHRLKYWSASLSDFNVHHSPKRNPQRICRETSYFMAEGPCFWS